MKKLTLAIFITALVFNLGCKKNKEDQDPSPVSPTSSLVKSMVFTDTTGVYHGMISYKYDAQGRLVRMIADNPPDQDSILHTFEYAPGRVIERIFNHDNTKYGISFYDLNSQGLAVTETDWGFSQNGDSSMSQITNFKYNVDKFMTEKKSYLHGDTTSWLMWTWQIADGNITLATLGISISGGTSVPETYEYYPNSVNTIGNRNMGKLFFGLSSVNLIRKSTMYSTIPVYANFSYTYDSMNRVTTEMIRGAGLVAGNYNIIFSYY